MIHEQAHGVPLRLTRRFESGWWVREARTSHTIGTIRHGANAWRWQPWPALGDQPPQSARTRRAACEALIEWHREHRPAGPSDSAKVSA